MIVGLFAVIVIVGMSSVEKLLIVGLGDVAQRALPEWLSRYEVTVLSRSAYSGHLSASLRHVAVSLDEWSLSAQQQSALAQSFDAVLYTVPPLVQADSGVLEDVRLHNLLRFWQQQGVAPKRVVYISTTGVYGDCGGEWVDETRALSPQSARAQGRVAAEHAWRDFAYATGAQVTVLRAPGIYALERLPYASVLADSPVLWPQEDSFSNHIHADDLARACLFFLDHSFLNQAAQGAVCLPFEVLNICDDEPLLMGEWMAALAQVLQRVPPQQVSRAQMQALVSPMRWSFMRESRRLRNAKLRSTGFVLRHSSALAFLHIHGEAIRAFAAYIGGGDEA